MKDEAELTDQDRELIEEARNTQLAVRAAIQTHQVSVNALYAAGLSLGHLHPPESIP